MLELYLAIKVHAILIAAAICVIGVVCLALTHYKRWKCVKNASKTDSSKLQASKKS